MMGDGHLVSDSGGSVFSALYYVYE